jgi:hypothetical protein
LQAFAGGSRRELVRALDDRGAVDLGGLTVRGPAPRWTVLLLPVPEI